MRDALSRRRTHLREDLTERVDTLLVETQRRRVRSIGTKQEAVAEILEQPEHLRLFEDFKQYAETKQTYITRPNFDCSLYAAKIASDDEHADGPHNGRQGVE